MRFISFYIQLFSIILIFKTTIFACTCVEYNTPVCASISRSDAVFTGKVEKITPFSANDSSSVSLGNVGSISTVGGNNLIWLHIKVDRKFKGIKDDFVKVLTYINTSCDLGIKKGEKWIFYASRDDNENLGVGACSGTTKISNDDKEYLEEVFSVSQDKNIESISGYIKTDRYSDAGIKDALITVEGKDFFSTTTSGGKGSFNISVPQAGKYNVSISIPLAAVLFDISYGAKSETIKMSEPTDTKSVLTYEVDVPQGQCLYSELEFFPIDLKATGEIKGKFIATDGKQFPKFYPQLCRVKQTEKDTLSSCKMDTDFNHDGSFSFSGLREGKFVIVVNPSDFPEVSTPYLRHYYPGVRNFKDAQIINFEQGQQLDGLIFNLLPMLPLREVKGQIFWNKKKPVTFENDEEKAYVSLHNPQRAISPLDNDYYKFWDEKKRVYEEVKTVEVRSDGTFSILAFDGFDYIIRVSAEDKQEKTHCGFAKITVNKDLQLLKMILNRTKKCWADDYAKELLKK